MRCPTCNSPSPHLHPAIQSEEEVEICLDPFHGPSPQQNFKAADILRDATRYIAKQFRITFTRTEAQSNLDTRSALLKAEWAVIDEAEAMLGKHPTSQKAEAVPA